MNRKERKYLPPGRGPNAKHCECCEWCGINMEGSPWNIDCGEACVMLCEEHCSSGGMGIGTEPVTFGISMR